jgi:hypothetical protein
MCSPPVEMSATSSRPFSPLAEVGSLGGVNERREMIDRTQARDRAAPVRPAKRGGLCITRLMAPTRQA